MEKHQLDIVLARMRVEGVVLLSADLSECSCMPRIDLLALSAPSSVVLRVALLPLVADVQVGPFW